MGSHPTHCCICVGGREPGDERPCVRTCPGQICEDCLSGWPWAGVTVEHEAKATADAERCIECRKKLPVRTPGHPGRPRTTCSSECLRKRRMRQIYASKRRKRARDRKERD